MAPAKRERNTTRCRPFQDFALASALKVKNYARALGLKRCKSQRIIKKRIDPRQEWPRIQDFMSRFRLPPACVEELTREFEASRFRPGLGEDEMRGSPIPLFSKVCYALRYLGTGSYYAVVRDTQGGVSRSSVGRAVDAFVKFLVSRYHRYVKFPKGQKLHEAAIRFSEKHDVHQCAGCIDGTLIPIKRPVRNEHAYVCRKAYHALNVLLACDHDERIMFVESGMAGCHHDQSVLEQSDLGHHLRYRNRLGNYFLLGDSGYALSPQVLTPFRCDVLSDLTEPQRKYQVAHVTARSSVERCIGQLKGRWRCLSRSGGGVMQMEPLQASWAIKACCILHNRCIDWGLRKLKPGQNVDPVSEQHIQEEAAKRFRVNNAGIDAENVPNAFEEISETYGPYHAGQLRRNTYIYNRYGGERPAMVRTRRGRGRGRGRRGGARD